MRRISLALFFAVFAYGGASYAQPLVTHPVTGQVVIGVTGTAIQLPSFDLLNGIVVRAKSGNNASCGTVGPATVTNTVDGTGNGFVLCPGEASAFAVPNSNILYVNGTSGDIFSFEGN